MCICCCCCGCFCNNRTTKCIEQTILVLSSVLFISGLIPLFVIKMSHIKIVSKIFIILTLVSVIINLLSIILIFFWRVKNQINTDKNSKASCLARLGLVLIILLFFFSIPVEALVKNDLNKIDYPCKDYVYNTDDDIDGDDTIIYLDNRDSNSKFSEEEKKFCEEKQDNNYYTHKCSNNEYVISYLIPSIIQVVTIVLCCLWFSEIKRINLKIDGAIERNAGNQCINPQFGMNYPMEGFGGERFQNNIMIYPYSNNMIQQQVIDFRNESSQHRFSQINMNFSRNRNDCFNYIRNVDNQQRDNESISNAVDHNISRNSKWSSRRSERSENSINSGSITKINGMNSVINIKKRGGKGKKRKNKNKDNESKKGDLFEITAKEKEKENNNENSKSREIENYNGEEVNENKSNINNE